MKLWKRAILCLLLGVAFTVAAAGAEQRELSGKLIRLHVLANSDSAEDQAIKLRVRDAVLKALEGQDWKTRQEAAGWLETHRQTLRQTAEAVSGQPAEVTLTEERYPTRTYDGFSLPAGKYLSLRVILGNGAGHNWWCVVYPAMCTAAQGELAQTAAAAGFTAGEIHTITSQSPPVQIKFKLLEWAEDAADFLRDNLTK